MLELQTFVKTKGGVGDGGWRYYFPSKYTSCLVHSVYQKIVIIHGHAASEAVPHRTVQSRVCSAESLSLSSLSLSVSLSLSLSVCLSLSLSHTHTHTHAHTRTHFHIFSGYKKYNTQNTLCKATVTYSESHNSV